MGAFVAGGKHGHGIYYWIEGSKYTGSWYKNRINGFGFYEGLYNMYKGEWKVGKMNGLGSYAWSDGRSYDGEYEKDVKSGFGTFIWADGRTYNGYWEEGRQHGIGKLTAGGRPGIGEWEKGNMKRWIERPKKVK
eukprot:GHVU01171444.1.p2 GENE.GHVU01171444.1~~GHVU01171444.1.p2  ORF type:complete len:134 (+),score=12.16 GHVU01171444.1:1505-1906(+)